MKARTIGDYFFMVAIYYTDKDGCMRCFNERWSRKEYAQHSKEIYEKHIERWFDGIEFQGKISSVFTYKCKQCIIG